MERPAPLTTISACLFAQGDAATFFTAAGALDAAADGLSCRIVIYDCGLDVRASAALVAFASADTRVLCRQAPNSDKAAAWNDYVSMRAGVASAHIFIDGDAAPAPMSFRALNDALAAAPRAYGATALAAAGRSRRAWARRTILGHGLNRHLYAVSNDFISRARALDVRLPFGLAGIDGLVAYLILTEFCCGPDDTQAERLIVADDAWFTFRALELRASDIRAWRAREAATARRRLEAQALYPRLKQGGLAAMPLTAAELFRQSEIGNLRLRRDPVGAWFDARARRAIYRAFGQAPSKTTWSAK